MKQKSKEFFISSLTAIVALYPSLLIVLTIINPYIRDFTLPTVILIESIIVAPILQFITLPLAYNFIKRITGM